MRTCEEIERLLRAIDQQLHTNLTGLDEIEKREQRMLHKRQSGRCLEIGALLFFGNVLLWTGTI